MHIYIYTCIYIYIYIHIYIYIYIYIHLQENRDLLTPPLLVELLKGFHPDLSPQPYGGNHALVFARPPCGKSPMKDKRACRALRTFISIIMYTSATILHLLGRAEATWNMKQRT